MGRTMNGIIGKQEKLDKDILSIEKEILRITQEILETKYTGTQEDLDRLQEQLAKLKKVVEGLGARNKNISGSLAEIRKDFVDLEKTILSLSTGALALSITFSSTFVTDQSIHIDFLRNAWVFFAATICIYPFSRLIDFFNRFGYPHNRLANFLVSLIGPMGHGCFTGGIGYFLIFAVLNLPE